MSEKNRTKWEVCGGNRTGKILSNLHVNTILLNSWLVKDQLKEELWGTLSWIRTLNWCFGDTVKVESTDKLISIKGYVLEERKVIVN